MEVQCQNCRFYEAMTGQLEGKGQCRRFPPVLLPSEKPDEVNLAFRAGLWPMIVPGAWCGEFKVQPPARTP
jgi:hypothetical protein